MVLYTKDYFSAILKVIYFPLDRFLLQGHFFIATALSRTLTKLALKYLKLKESEPIKQNRFIAESMYIMASVLHYGKSGLAKKSINEDDTDSINVCLRVLSERSVQVVELFDDQSKQALNTLLDAKLHDEQEYSDKTGKSKASKAKIQADDPLRFGQLMSANDMGDKEDVFDLTLKQAIGALTKKEEDFITSSKLNKVRNYKVESTVILGTILRRIHIGVYICFDSYILCMNQNLFKTYYIIINGRGLR